jgi:tyrosinase
VKAVSSMSICSSFNPDQLVAATIPLTTALMDRISENKLRSLDAVDVEPYIMQNLQYRIAKVDDTEVENNQVPSLKISIVSAEVQRPENDTELLKWGEMVGHMDVSMASG